MFVYSSLKTYQNMKWGKRYDSLTIDFLDCLNMIMLNFLTLHKLLT